MAVRPIRPHELLDLAEELAGKNAGPGKPRTIRLRRSISTSYYAVFHELSFRAVAQLYGTTEWGETQSSVARWITHTDLAELARAATRAGGSASLRDALGTLHPDLARIAQDFLDLQDARHGADYDHTYDVSKATALGFAASARGAIERSHRLVEGGEPSYGRFLSLAIGGVKVAKRR